MQKHETKDLCCMHNMKYQIITDRLLSLISDIVFRFDHAVLFRFENYNATPNEHSIKRLKYFRDHEYSLYSGVVCLRMIYYPNLESTNISDYMPPAQNVLATFQNVYNVFNLRLYAISHPCRNMNNEMIFSQCPNNMSC